MSAPSSAGVFNLASANKSQTKIAFPFFLCIRLILSLGSFISPKVPGYDRTPQIISSSIFVSSVFSSPMISSKPKGFVLVLIRSIV